ncbi:MAG: toll/interleukin-1 receptor domain-containing protein [Lachnospiraceae bacterium]|nr:toll/interleukin-1 receptor domain-containing protein [Lachnospiraceae bacterium]
MESDKTFRDNLEQALASDGFEKKETSVYTDALKIENTMTEGEGKIDVFLSYSSKNKNVADAVVAEFEQHGIRCWYAPRDIVPGQEWVSAIHDAITACSLFVLIYTDSSNESRQVANEVALAFNSGKTLIPFRLTDAEMSSELEYYLTRVHWLDAVNPPLRQSMENLREYSERILRGEVPREAKLRNANTAASGRKTGARWLYPALAVLAVALVAAVVVLVKSLLDKPAGEGGAATPTGTAVSVTEAEATRFPNDPKALYEQAYGLQMADKDRAAYDAAYECYVKTGDVQTDDEKIIDAMYALASYYYEEGSTEDAAKGLALYRKAAACGSVKANNFLGNYYLEVDRDNKSECSRWTTLSPTSEALISCDLCDAISYYTVSAEKGDAIALYSLGLIFENENDYYTITPDYGKALAYYEQAEKAGHANAAKARERVREKLQDAE